MLPILRSVIPRSVVSRRSFSTTNSNAWEKKLGGVWSYIGPVVLIGVGYGVGGVLHGDNVAYMEEFRIQVIKTKSRILTPFVAFIPSSPATEGALWGSLDFVDVREKMWAGDSMWSATGKCLSSLSSHVKGYMKSMSLSQKS